MPKFVDDFVSERLKDKSFYPELSEKERKSIAFAIANKTLNKKKQNKNKKKSFFIGVNTRYSELLRLCRYLDHKGQYRTADKIVEALNRGEFWIEEDGSTKYADGDVGDLNHAMVAEQEMISRLGIYFEDEIYSIENARELFDQSINDEGAYGPEGIEDYIQDLKSDYGDDWADEASFDHFIVWNSTQQGNNHPAMLIQSQKTLEGFKDPVTFAIENYGWIRAEINRNYAAFQTKNLNEMNFEKILSCLLGDYPEDSKIQPDYKISLEVQSPVVTSLNFTYDEFNWYHVWEEFKSSIGFKEPVSGPNLSTPNMPEFYQGREGD
jgi:hypothetical protein